MTELLEYLADIVFLLVAVRVLYSGLRRLLAPTMARRATRAPSAGEVAQVRGEMARDPVCGMFVSTEVSHRLKWRGQTLHFCSEECLEKYRHQPMPVSSDP